MKNIHIIRTNKPSRLLQKVSGLQLHQIPFKDVNKIGCNRHIYITSEEKDINENDYIITKDGRLVQVSYLLFKDLEGASKVILTTDQDLIKDGVQSIDDEFLEWFVKNPSCEFVRLKDSKIAKDHIWDGTNDGEIIWEKEIIIPQEEPNPFELPKTLPDDVFFKSLEEPKQETLEEAGKFAEIRYLERLDNFQKCDFKDGVIEGAKWQKEQDKNKYSENEVKNILECYLHYLTADSNLDADEWFENYKKK